jgi:hypothetical protein
VSDNLVSRFFYARFRDLAPGFIEVRLIEDCKDGKLVGRKWYPSVDAFLGDLPRLQKVSERRRVAIHYGVLPRREKNKGKAEDVLPGRVVWVDIDFKDFDGGEPEARERLAHFQLQPSIVVRSGHGLHAYWLLREDYDPNELSEVSRWLAKHLGGDHAFDAARILRAPGSFNRKDPANPLPVVIETFEPDRQFNLSEIVEALDLLGTPSEVAEKHQEGGGTEYEFGGTVSQRVLDLIRSVRKLADLWIGKGKVAKDENGQSFDTSESGYDFSFVLALAREGITDLPELATALNARPDGHARRKGQRYVRLTVANALRVAQDNGEHTDQATPVDFTVEKVRRYDSDPARYEFLIDGKVISLSSAELKTKGKLELRLLDALNRVPALPRKAEQYRLLVNSWLAQAEIVEMPPEASAAEALKEDVQRAIDGLPVGDSVEDLDHGKGCKLADGRVAFKAAAIHRLLRDDHPELGAAELCATLKSLKYESVTRAFGEGRARAWVRE